MLSHASAGKKATRGASVSVNTVVKSASPVPSSPSSTSEHDDDEGSLALSDDEECIESPNAAASSPSASSPSSSFSSSQSFESKESRSPSPTTATPILVHGSPAPTITALDAMAAVRLVSSSSLGSSSVAGAGYGWDEEVEADGVLRESVRQALSCPQAGCSAAFWSRGGLAQHLRTHSGDKPFICTSCPAAFTSRAMLDQHSVTHDDSESTQKKFVCDWCGTSFNRMGNFTRHCTLGACAPAALDTILGDKSSASPRTTSSASSSSFPNVPRVGDAMATPDPYSSSPEQSEYGSSPSWCSPDFDSLSYSSSSPATEFGDMDFSALFASTHQSSLLEQAPLVAAASPSSYDPSIWGEYAVSGESSLSIDPIV